MPHTNPAELGTGHALEHAHTCQPPGWGSCLLASDNFPLPWYLWHFPERSSSTHKHPPMKSSVFKVNIWYKPLKGVIWVFLTCERFQSRGYRWAAQDLSVPRREERWGHQLLHQAQDKPPQHRAPLVLPLAEVGGQAAWRQTGCPACLWGGPHHLSAKGSLPSARAPCYQHPRGLSRYGAGVQTALQLVQGPFSAVKTPTLEQAVAAAKSADTHLVLAVWHPGDNSLFRTPRPMLLQ